MIFISAQPDKDYFVWQLRVQIANLQELGFKDEYHIIVKVFKDLVNPGFLQLEQELKDTNFKFFYYWDKRQDWNTYLSSMRPHILAQHFDIYSYKEFFYIDSDIIFRELPNFSLLHIGCYVSNTISYTGGEYILSKSWELLKGMASIVGISPERVLLLNKHSGGAQYVIRGVDANFWRKVEKDSINLYLYMVEFNKTFNGHGIQAWTADMWAVQWNLWLLGLDCKVHQELDFCWPTQLLSEWDKCKILHNAGVTPDRKDLFYKAEYIVNSPIGKDLSYADPKYCSIKYVEYINKLT